jgi:hypothetical protein
MGHGLMPDPERRCEQAREKSMTCGRLRIWGSEVRILPGAPEY